MVFCLQIGLAAALSSSASAGESWPKPYSPPCVERENVFEFAEKPSVKVVGKDRYEITFAAKGWCDVAVGIVDENGVVVRHLGAGVLGPISEELAATDALLERKGRPRYLPEGAGETQGARDAWSQAGF